MCYYTTIYPVMMIGRLEEEEEDDDDDGLMMMMMVVVVEEEGGNVKYGCQRSLGEYAGRKFQIKSRHAQ